MRENKDTETLARKEEYSESFVMLPKKYFRPIYEFNREPLEDFDIMVYAIVDSMRTGLLDCAFLDVKDILKLTGYYPNSANIKRIKEALLTLQRQEVILISTDGSLNECVLQIDTKQKLFMKRCIELQSEDDSKKLYYVPYQNEGFVKIFTKDLFKMLHSSIKHKEKILRVYVEIMSHVFYTLSSSRAVYPSIDLLAGQTGYDRKTVMKIIDDLCNVGVLLCVQLHYEKKSKNFYSRVIHQEELRSSVKAHIENKKVQYGIPRMELKGHWKVTKEHLAS